MVVGQRAGERLFISLPRRVPSDGDFAKPDGGCKALRSGMVGARKLQVGPSPAKTDAVKRSVPTIVFTLTLVGLAFMLALESFAKLRPLVASSYGDTAIRSGQFGDAASSLRYSKRSLWFDPKPVGVRLELARDYEEIGADMEALKEYQQVIDLNPHSYEA